MRIVSLDGFDDNLCAWRCAALGLFNIRADRSTKKAFELAREFFKLPKRTPKKDVPRLNIYKEMAAVEATLEGLGLFGEINCGSLPGVVIPVQWHVVRSGTSISQGNIPDSWINAQISVLNQAYQGSGFSFQLAGVSRTTLAVVRSTYTAPTAAAARSSLGRTLIIMTSIASPAVRIASESLIR